VKRFGGKALGYLSLICFWLTYEYLHLNWDAPWPWLNLGNGFASRTDWIQWYEYTGAEGGTLWVLLVNIFLFEALSRYFAARKTGEKTGFPIWMGLFFAGLIFPIGLSYMIKPEKPALNSVENIVAVQPNIDPYNVKFDESTFAKQVNTLISLSEKAIDSNTVLVTWPETAIAEDIDESHILYYTTIQTVLNFLDRHRKVKLITGSSSVTVYGSNKGSPTARMFIDKSGYYDIFNTALLLDWQGHAQYYHKSKLVPGVEKMPYPAVLGFLEKLAINMGGATGSLGSQDSPAVFRINEKLVAAPVICYESIFGEYVSEYILKGANVITIITNDGWWKDTPGYKQHVEYAALRAIENRCFVSRSANTGTSCFILPDGTIIDRTGWWQPAVIKSQFCINSSRTFYTEHGDFVCRLAMYPGFLFVLFALFGGLIRRGELNSD
jgi:apolipoprotein N-acyltransferase